jgi:hypothetical protein
MLPQLLLEIQALLTPVAYAPGSPNLAAKPLLQELARELPTKAKDRAFALACMAGLWLYHDFLDESHAISQELDTAEGSYWHALMHRREPDYWNSKYWFRRVPRHFIFDDLCKQAAALTEQAGVPQGCAILARQRAWDAPGFVDLCELAAGAGGELERLCRQVQRSEFDLLFGYCHERAFSI